MRGGGGGVPVARVSTRWEGGEGALCGEERGGGGGGGGEGGEGGREGGWLGGGEGWGGRVRVERLGLARGSFKF